MKFRYFSDLHLEFIKPNYIKQFIHKIPHGFDEICILAGDIGNPFQPNYNFFMQYISRNFKKSFVITGNHEYYGHTIQETNDFLSTYFQQFHNITFLNNSFECYENYCFVGSTLWSKITNNLYEINDVYKINDFDYLQYNLLNQSAVQFLTDTLETQHNCIIITHHMPSESLIDIKYKNKLLNQWFYCNMDDFIDKYQDKIICWVYGHTHTPCITIKHNIHFLCNPIGYPNENRKLYFDRSIEF